MANDIESRLAEQGIVLPQATSPLADYVPYVAVGNLVFISGQLPMENGKLAVVGKLGGVVSIEEGIRAARLCAVNILAQLKSACGGDWGRVERCVRLGGFVASVPEFTDQPKVVNGASAVMRLAMGEDGRHSRAAVGVPVLPLDAAVEIEAVFALKQP